MIHDSTPGHADHFATVDALLNAATVLGLPSRYRTVALTYELLGTPDAICTLIVNLSRS